MSLLYAAAHMELSIGGLDIRFVPSLQVALAEVHLRNHALAGPTRRLLKQARSLLGGQCEVFYAGSVAPPNFSGSRTVAPAPTSAAHRGRRHA